MYLKYCIKFTISYSTMTLCNEQKSSFSFSRGLKSLRVLLIIKKKFYDEINLQ